MIINTRFFTAGKPMTDGSAMISCTCTGRRHSFLKAFAAAWAIILMLGPNPVKADTGNFIGTASVNAPTTVSLTAGQTSAQYSAYAGGAYPVLKNGEVVAKESWHWTENCTPQDGSATVTVSYTAGGAPISVAACDILFTIADAQSGKRLRIVRETCTASTIINFAGSPLPVSAAQSPAQEKQLQSPVAVAPPTPAPATVPAVLVNNFKNPAAPPVSKPVQSKPPALVAAAPNPVPAVEPPMAHPAAKAFYDKPVLNYYQQQQNDTAPTPTIDQNPPTPPALTTTAPITLPDYHEAAGPALTIDQSVEIALEKNTEVANAELSLRRVRYQSEEITGQAYPQISVSASDTYNNRDSSPGGVTGVSSNLNTSGLTIPTITDSQSNTLLSSSSSASSAQTASASTSTVGSGSSTSTTTATIVPVTGPVGGTSSGAATSDALQAASHAKSPLATGTVGSSPIIQQFTSTPFRLNNYGGKLSLSQVVDVNGLISTSEKLLKNEVAFYELDLTRVQNEVAYNVKNQYYAVLRAEQQLTTDNEQVTNSQAELTDAQERYNAGTSPEFDVVSAQTQLSSAQQSLLDAEITVDVQRATLNNLLNQPMDTPFTTIQTPTPALPAGDTDTAEIATANANRPELQQSTLALDIANKLIKLDRAGLLPQVALTAVTTYNGYASFPNGLGTNSSVTAAVTLPLFDGGQTAARVNEAHMDEQKQQVNRQTLLNDIALEVRSSFVNVRNGTALVDANIQAVAEAKESLRLANIRYKTGTGTLLEVTNAEANLAVAETNLSTAQFQLSTEYASLLRSEGLR